MEADDFPVPSNAENDLQPFFVLHKGWSRKSERKSSVKTRRKIDLSPPLTETAEGFEYDDQFFENLRMEAFAYVWSKTESAIKEVLRNMNEDVYCEIDQWVHQSFNTMYSGGMPDSAKVTCSYPIKTDAISKRLFTGLVLTRNMEFVDDLLTFADLGLHLRSHGCHVANLSSLDFSVKNGISGSIRNLLRKFIMVSLDAADISILASWYFEQGNYENPIVVIIEDLERCCRTVLSDFILMLSEWVVKIPVILIMGVSTTIDAPKNVLSSNALQYLSPCKFILGSPAERLDKIIDAVLVRQSSGFGVGHKVATFLRNCFLRQDGTLISFVRGLKMAIIQHFSAEPLSFILKDLLSEEDSQVSWSRKHEALPEVIFKRAFDLPSFTRNKFAEPTGEIWDQGLSELKRLLKLWSSVVLCLYEAGKYQKITLLDLYCESLDPELYHSRASDHHSVLKRNVRMPSSNHSVLGQPLDKGGFISQSICKVRDLSVVALSQLLESWGRHTESVNEIHEKVKELQESLLDIDGNEGLHRELTDISRRHTTRSKLNEKAAELIGVLVRDYMQPIERITFHEIVCFKNVDKLQWALTGDPRRRIRVDLLESYKILNCNCCRKSSNTPMPSMHDTAVLYALAQEQGDLINLHDWYQSFKANIYPTNKGKHKLKSSPSPKKRKTAKESQTPSEASLQARFCRAVMELQITGLLRMPSKRRPDYVQRVAFGL